ncbi:MAG TPA: ABC transporter ATP-binding protein [Phycisphaerales bacterium]|nr:ABC transporter ATP-binding protein [Phycisphaerales bacterium]HMP38419.1 ABC transporter ATP-binding protein [Phycisphaerales bacterium]
MVEAHGLTRHYGARTAVEGLSFAVPRGSITGFLGPNGAGKTTTLRMLVGVLLPSAGSIKIHGIDLGAEPRRARRLIGYLPETTPNYPELRVEQYLRFRGRLQGLGGGELRIAVDRWIDRCELGTVRRRLIGALSKGFRQRVGLAAALVHDPAVLVLDEPGSGLDPAQVIEFRGILRGLAGSRTVILSSHVLTEIEAVCDRVLMIAHGRLVAADTIEGLRRRGGIAGGPGGRIVVETLGERVDALRAIAGVAEAHVLRRDGPWVRQAVVAADPESDLRERVARALAATGTAVRELAPSLPSLEELFLALAGGAAEDAVAGSTPASVSAGARR